jgi:hypothetical protein
MKRKHLRTDPKITVITDPKKLAWLKAKIAEQEAGGAKKATVKRVRPA